MYETKKLECYEIFNDYRVFKLIIGYSIYLMINGCF